MQVKKKRWLLGCGCGALALSTLVALAVLAWMWMAARVKQPAPVVEVVTWYPGMPASSIEKTITNRIERWVNQAHDASEVTSRSLAGVSIVRVSFRDDIDFDLALTQVNELAQGAQPTLPPDTPPPVVLPRDPRYAEPLGVLSVRSAMVDDTVLWELAKVSVRDRLLFVPGAVAPLVLGGRDSMVIIDFDQKKMAARKVSLQDVGKALKAAYGDDLARTFVDNSLVLDGRKRPIRRDELNRLGVRTEDGEVVRLGDIASVLNDSTEPTVRFRVDGRPAVGVHVYAQRGVSRQKVYRKLTEELPSLRQMIEERQAQLRWVPLAAEHKWPRELDDGLLKLYLRAPSGTRLEETEKRVVAVERFLENHIPAKEREAIVSEVGMTPDLSALFTANAGPMDATILVQLAPDRTLDAAAYAGKLRRLLNDAPGFAELSIRFASHDMPAPVDIRIAGEKREEAMGLAQEIRRRLQVIKGTADVDIAQRADDVEIDHVSLRRVFNVRANIEVRDHRDVIADLRNMLQELKTPTGIEVKLVD